MVNLLAIALLAGTSAATAGERGAIGVRFADHPEGMVITRVIDGSGAQAAGLVTGDRIVSVDGIDVTSGEDVPPLRGEIGSHVTLGVHRPLSTELVSITVERGKVKKVGSEDEGTHPAVARFAGAMRMDGKRKVKKAATRLVNASYGGQDAADAIGQKLVRAAKRRKGVARAALKAFEQVQEPPPGLMFRVGEAYFTLRKYDDAKHWLDRAIEGYPDDTARAIGARGRAEEMLANAYWETGERQLAIDLTRRLARYRRVLPLTKKVGMADPTPEKRWEIDLPPLADFSVETMAGDTWSLSEQQGKPVVLVFWATWCGPCKKEMPALAELVNKRPGWPVSFLAISVDEDRAAAKAEKMVKDWNLPFPSVRTSELMERFGVSSLPSMRVIGPNGSLRSSSRGYSEHSVKKLETTVEGLVAEAKDATNKASAFPFGSAWSSGQINLRSLASVDGVRRIAASPDGVTADVAGHGGLSLRLEDGRVMSGLEVEESLKSKRDAGVAWFKGPVSYGNLWIRARSPDGSPKWFMTMPSRIKAVTTSGEQLWVALKDEIVVMDESGSVVHRVPQKAVALASATDGGVWAVDGSERIRVGPTGEVLLRDSAEGAAHIVGDGRWATSSVKSLISGAFGPEGQTRTVGVNGMGLIVGLDGEGQAALRIHIEGSEKNPGPSITSADLDGDGQDELLISSWGRGVATVDVEIP